MADGSSKSISAVRVGDRVADAVPGSGVAQVHAVERVIVTTTDHDFVDVWVKPTRGVVRSLAARVGRAAAGVALAAAAVLGAAQPAAAATSGGSDSSATVTTTFHHPFYDVTQAAFVEAVSLKPGDALQTVDGGTATVTAVRPYHTTEVTYDLTINGLHTYYVEAGDTPVLVHNCGGMLGDAEYAAMEHAHGTNVAEGVDYMAQRMHDGSATELDHEIPGIGHDLPTLGDYLASWRGRLKYRDTQTGASVAYDQARGTLIVQNSYMIHAYQYSYDSFVNSGRYVLP